VQGSEAVAAVDAGVPVCLGSGPLSRARKEVSWLGFCSRSNLGLESERGGKKKKEKKRLVFIVAVDAWK